MNMRRSKWWACWLIYIKCINCTFEMEKDLGAVEVVKLRMCMCLITNTCIFLAHQCDEETQHVGHIMFLCHNYFVREIILFNWTASTCLYWVLIILAVNGEVICAAPTVKHGNLCRWRVMEPILCSRVSNHSLSFCLLYGDCPYFTLHERDSTNVLRTCIV